ncbi:hypothetical protein DXG03_003060 [Asterophora parasitica]|uniref:MICOS complex subunit n=1 Tax=Asterophora parasitica TaxID=117018 RepID=A0A9P7K9I3_9AGAR|nr:hypothetical protein DXG03_003060 [Asterophora parasitica]
MQSIRPLKPESPRRALLSASAAATGVVLHTSPQSEKLSIYPSQTPDVLLVETPSPLEEQIGVARRRVTETYREAHSRVQGVISRWIGVEHAIENRVKAIISPNESLTPGLLYVGVATLTGSIIARNRFLGTRLLLPPLFLFLSAKQFIPQTTANLSAYLGSLEEKYFPTLAQKHDIANAHSEMAWERLKDATQNGRQWVNHSAEVAVDKVQETTGLKLKETLGWAQKRVEVQVTEVAKVVEEKVVETKAAIDKAVEEVKVEASPPVEEVKTEEVKRLV